MWYVTILMVSSLLIRSTKVYEYINGNKKTQKQKEELTNKLQSLEDGKSDLLLRVAVLEASNRQLALELEMLKTHNIPVIRAHEPHQPSADTKLAPAQSTSAYRWLSWLW
jgi:hypothetical protein